MCCTEYQCAARKCKCAARNVNVLHENENMLYHQILSDLLIYNISTFVLIERIKVLYLVQVYYSVHKFTCTLSSIYVLILNLQ